MAKEKDYRQELLVSGFVREIEAVYKIKNIPNEIVNIIYVYQRIYDEWDKIHSSHNVTFDTTKNKVTFTLEDASTVFGSEEVDDGIFKWKIKIISMTQDSTAYPCIGIIKDEESILEKYKDRDDWESNGYQFCGGTGYLYDMNDESEGRELELRWKKPNDILEIILDLNTGTMELSVNGEDFVVAWGNEDNYIKKGKYRLALSCYNAGEKFELI